MNYSNSAEPTGIGGWLILVILGLVISPIRTTMFLVNDLLPIFTSDAWQNLTTSDSPVYHPLWAPLISFEVIGNVGSIILALVTLTLMIRRAKRTATWAIGWLAWSAFFVTVDYFLANLIPSVANQPDPESLKEVFRSMSGALIWIPYFRISKRVKNTFINQTNQSFQRTASGGR